MWLKFNFSRIVLLLSIIFIHHSKVGGDKIFVLFLKKILCSPRLHLLKKKK